MLGFLMKFTGDLNIEDTILNTAVLLLVYFVLQEKHLGGWECSSVAEHLPDMCKALALGSVPIIGKRVIWLWAIFMELSQEQGSYNNKQDISLQPDISLCPPEQSHYRISSQNPFMTLGTATKKNFFCFFSSLDITQNSGLWKDTCQELFCVYKW